MPASPSISDKEFFSLLDYSLPYLSNIESAVKKEDYSAAKTELLKVMRSRRKPVFRVNWWEKPEKTDPHYDRALAESVCKHIFAGFILDKYPPYEMGEKIKWDASPFKDREWAWIFNRHYNWRILGQAYWATGDEKYAREFVDELVDWVSTCPVVTDGKHNDSASWRSLEAGIRLYDTWPDCIQYFMHSPSFTPDVLALMMKSMVEHARLLVKYPTGGNWLTMESNGLIHLGTLFPEFKDSSEWRRVGMERLAKEIGSQVYPDGFQFELTTTYHMVTVSNFTSAYEILTMNGIPAPDGYKKSLEKLYEAALYAIKPTGSLPALNDSDLVIGDEEDPDGMGAKEWLAKGAELFGRDDMKFAASSWRDGKAPAETSHTFPYAGYYVMRSAWNGNARYLFFDAGPFGAGHQHEDKLGIDLCAYGKTLLYDPGRFTYAESPYRDYFHGTRGHNTCVVDGKNQNRRGQKPEERKWVVSEPVTGNVWVSKLEYDYASGVYDEGYGPDNDKSVTHKRQVVFVKPDYWIIIDTFDGTGEHEIETFWHFRPGKVKVEKAMAACVTDNQGEANLAVIPASTNGFDINIAEGQTDPIRGWIAPAYNIKIPAPEALYKWKGKLPASFAWLLYPQKTPFTRLPQFLMNGSTYQVKLPDGRSDCISISTDGKVTIRHKQ